jgi:hypothetical protein
MTQKTNSVNRNYTIFIASFIIYFVLTILSFVGAGARDEGNLTADGSMIWNLIADSFSIFRFPSHVLFWDFITKHMGFFLPGLILNVFIWSLMTERIIVWTRYVLIKTS